MYGDPTPQVVKWFRVYCGVLLAIMVAIFGFFCFAALSGSGGKDDDVLLGLVVIGIVLLPFMAAYGWGLFLPRRPWAWVVGMVMIAFGLSSICTIPAAIALMVFWTKPECQTWFGRRGQPPPPSASTAVFD